MLGKNETRRYYLPNARPLEGWAEVLICGSGMLAAVSDYGNYAYAWRSFGAVDFRQFLLNAERDIDYFTKKLQQGGDGLGDVYDGDATAAHIRERILTSRRDRSWSKEKAREEWQIVEGFDDLHSEHDFALWYDRTEMSDASEMRCRRRNPQALAFVERVLAARLCPILREELKAEELT